MAPFEACCESVEAVERGLHELCQPVTALQCRLEIGQRIDTDAAQREAVRGALEEAARIFAAISHLRSQVAAMERELRSMGGAVWH